MMVDFLPLKMYIAVSSTKIEHRDEEEIFFIKVCEGEIY